MGAWSTDILGNDLASNVYSFFEKLYNKQEKNIEQIKQETIARFGLLNQNNEPVFGNEQWLAYACICWECKALDQEAIEVIANILNDKTTIEEEWEEFQ